MAEYRATGSLAASRIVLDGATQWCYTRSRRRDAKWLFLLDFCSIRPSPLLGTISPRWLLIYRDLASLEGPAGQGA